MKLLKKNATYDDLRGVSDHFVAEMLTGDLYAFPRPALPHARASSVLGAALTGPFDQGRNGPGGWLILDGPELHFGHDVLVPDLAAWRRERLPTLPAEAYMTLAAIGRSRHLRRPHRCPRGAVRRRCTRARRALGLRGVRRPGRDTPRL